jgi:3-deoxy-manno-octulosonate cytidylyltransferase (CMP-KDO synthetase)
MNAVIVIPARFQSGRLPGKPMIDLAGVPMIERTYRRCALGFPAEHIYVATDDERIYRHCVGVGIRTLMTSPDCPTGTDRVAEVADSVAADLYINVQGDEPLFNPRDIQLILDAAEANPGEVLNGVCPIDTEERFRSPSIPKVVMRPDGRLLYMSRAAIPTSKAFEFKKAWRQICIYAFTPEALRAYRSVKGKTGLEQIEDIEILRFLELGFDVRMVPVSSDSVAVDTPADVATVEDILRQGDS